MTLMRPRPFTAKSLTALRIVSLQSHAALRIAGSDFTRVGAPAETLVGSRHGWTTTPEPR